MNPWKYADAVRILRENGWYLRRSRGSHRIFRKDGIREEIVVPYHGPKALSPGIQRDIMRKLGISPRDL